MLTLVSPIARWILALRYWLFSHGFFWLGLHLPQIIRGILVYGLVALWLIEVVREIRLLWVLPKRARRLSTLGHNEKALALMKRSVRAFTPLLGTRPHYFTRAYSLGVMLQNAGRFGRLVRSLGANRRASRLATGVPRPRCATAGPTIWKTRATRAVPRMQRDIAQQKMDRIANTRGGDGWQASLQNAKRAQDANNFPEALRLFERALDAPKFGLLSGQRDALEAELACHVSLSAHHCGDNERAESAARRTLEQAKIPFMRAQGFRALANALSTQNRLDEALEASRAALEECEKHGDEQIVADSRAQYALLVTNMGQVEAALRECEISIEMGLHASRMALHGAANCHSLQGDFASARDYLERARRAKAFPSPAAERQMQGLLDMEGANIELSATRYGGEDRAQFAWDLFATRQTKFSRIRAPVVLVARQRNVGAGTIGPTRCRAQFVGTAGQRTGKLRGRYGDSQRDLDASGADLHGIERVERGGALVAHLSGFGVRSPGLSRGFRCAIWACVCAKWATKPVQSSAGGKSWNSIISIAATQRARGFIRATESN